MTKATYIFALSLITVASAWAQGPLVPPGPPAPTMRTLEEMEPRIPIDSVPVSITQPGSYYLTGNVELPSGTGSAIAIQSDGVTLDLMGFTISGGAQFGIRVQPPTDDAFEDITIRNGTINGFGTGLYLIGSVGGLYEDLQILNATSTGLWLSTASQGNVIRRSTIANAGAIGVNMAVSGEHRVLSDNLIEDCVIVGNGSHGIRLRASSAAKATDNIIRRCTILNNGVGAHYGVSLEADSAGSSVSGNEVIDSAIANNASRGVAMRPLNAAITHTRLKGNAIHGHVNAGVIGSPGVGTTGDVSGTRIAGNVLSWNRFNGGIRFNGSLTASQMVVRDNVLADNGVGTASAHLRFQVGERNRIQGNHVSGTQTSSTRGLLTEDTEGQLVIHNSVFGEPFAVSDDDRYGQIVTGTPIPNSQWVNFHLD